MAWPGHHAGNSSWILLSILQLATFDGRRNQGTVNVRRLQITVIANDQSDGDTGLGLMIIPILTRMDTTQCLMFMEVYGSFF